MSSYEIRKRWYTTKKSFCDGSLEPQGGFEPANLPITNRLRCHCATGA